MTNRSSHVTIHRFSFTGLVLGGTKETPPMTETSTNPTGTTPTREVALGTLAPGSQFISHPVVVGNVTYPGNRGTLLYATNCRARVRLRKASTGRKFQTKDGDSVQFAGLDTHDTDWAPDTLVEFIGQDPNWASMKPSTKGQASSKTTTTTSTTSSTKSSTTTSHEDQKETDMTALGVSNAARATEPATTTTTGPVAVVDARATLLNKWKFTASALHKALKVDSASSQSTLLRDKLVNLYEEAVAAQVVLPQPEFADPVFESMELGNGNGTETPAAAPTPSPKTKKATVPASVKDKEAVAARSKAKGTAKVAKAKEKAPKATKTPTEKTAKAPKVAAPKAAKSPRTKKAPENDCLCGCGSKVRGNFKQGHDATYRSRILQVEREEMKQSELPKGMKGKDGAALDFKKVRDGFKCTNSVLKH